MWMPFLLKSIDMEYVAWMSNHLGIHHSDVVRIGGKVCELNFGDEEVMYFRQATLIYIQELEQKNR